MSTTTSTTGVTVTLSAGRLLAVSAAVEGAVDIVAGVIGASQGTKRVGTAEVVFGPYGTDATLNIRSVGGGVVTYADKLKYVPARMEVDPVTNVATGNIQAPENGPVLSLPQLSALAARLGIAERSRSIHAPIGGQFASIAGQASFTYGYYVQSDVPFDGGRIVCKHCDPTPLPGVKVSMASNPNWLNDKSGVALTYTQGTWGGASSGTLAAGTAQRPSVNTHDMIPCPSQARTDGGTGYIAQFRVYFPTGGTLPICLNQTADMTQLAVLPAGMFMSERTAGDFTNTPAGFGGTYPGRSDTPIWGVELLCRGKVVSFIEFGDSITRGQTVTDVLNRNFGERACLAQSLAAGGIAFSNANCGWSSQTTDQYWARAQDVLAVLSPTCAVYAPFSPNDYGGTITQAIIDFERYKLGAFVSLCRSKNIIPAIWTGTPAAGNKAWNAASDNLRKAFNADIRTLYAATAIIFDADAALSDGASPANLMPSYTNDQIHWNNGGHAAAAARFAQDVIAKIQAAMP